MLKQNFRPEFLNRLDEIIYFKALEKDVVYGIVELLLRSLAKRIREKGIALSVTKEAIQYLIDEGYDITYGARPLKRIIQSEIETMLARKIIGKEIVTGEKIEIFLDKEKNELDTKKIPRKEIEKAPANTTKEGNSDENT